MRMQEECFLGKHEEDEEDNRQEILQRRRMTPNRRKKTHLNEKYQKICALTIANSAMQNSATLKIRLNNNKSL